MERIKSRILKLQAQKVDMLLVVFSNGRKSRISPTDGIELIRGRPNNILRFEGGGGSLADLLNELLKEPDNFAAAQTAERK